MGWEGNARESLLRSRGTITIFGEKKSVLKLRKPSWGEEPREIGLRLPRRMLIALQRQTRA